VASGNVFDLIGDLQTWMNPGGILVPERKSNVRGG